MTLGIKRRAYLVLATILAIGLAVVAGFAGPARAVQGDLELDNINANADSSIIVHKHANPSSGQANHGEELTTPPTGKALEGVEFTVTEYTCNAGSITSPELWKKIPNLTSKEELAANGCTAGTPTTVKTNGDGIAQFTGLKPGIFLVEEGEDKGNNNINAKAAPFVVVLPMPDKDKKDWQYTVHAYPKNTVIDKPVKELVTPEAGDPGYKQHFIGEQVSWDVTATVPTLGNEEELTSFIVRDTFVDNLEPIELEGAYATVIDKTSENGFVDVALTTDDYTVARAGQEVKVTFTETGLAKLQDKQGKKVTVRFHTKVVSLPGDGKIKNKATVFVNDPDTSGGGTPTDEVETPWGSLQIHKRTADGKKGLNGAIFKVYLNENDAKDETADAEIATIDMSNGADSAPLILKAGTYYVKETTAPAGYVKPADAITVMIPAGDGVDVTVEETVKNVKSDVPDLPFTGAAGQMILMVGGAAIILLAAGVALLAVKRRKN